eukprot:1289692-Ditylum_brightwellii.AAC.1
MAGSRFAINTYQHWQTLVLRGEDELIMSKEDLTQGDLLSMILYALAVLPLILILDQLLDILPFKERQLQEWFADDAALAGCYAAINHWFVWLCEIGPPCGYILEPSKSILVTGSDNIE